MLRLSQKWAAALLAQPETGMSYQIATVVLSDGQRYERVTIVGGVITDIAGQKRVPFAESEIAEIHVTHDK